MIINCKLTNEGINSGCEHIRGFLENTKIPHNEVIKMTLLVEETLLQYQEFCGEDTDYSMNLYPLFNAFKIDISIKGEKLDPFSSNKDEAQLLNEQILLPLLIQDRKSEFPKLGFYYLSGFNLVRITLKAPAREFRIKIPGGTNTVAVILAIMCGCVFALIPEAMSSFVLEAIVQPLTSTLLGVISAVTIPLIFISVLSSVCVMDDITALNTIGLKALGMFVFLSVLITTVTMGISQIVFPVISLSGEASLSFSQFTELLLSIIPNSLIKPFVEENAIQIVLIALLSGTCILLLGPKVQVIKKAVSEINLVITKMMELVSVIIPLLIFLCIFQTMLKYSVKEIVSMWKFVVAAHAAQLIVVIMLSLYLMLRRHVNIIEFVKQIYPVLIITLTTAASSPGIAPMLDISKSKLKVNGKLCDFLVPFSHALFSPAVLPLLTMAGFFGAYYSQMNLSVMNLIVLFMLVIQLGIASPKVPGGVIAVLAMLLTQFGFDTESIGMITLANAFVVNLGTAFGAYVRCFAIKELSYRVEYK